MGFVRDGRIVMTTDADFEAMAALAAAGSATETGGGLMLGGTTPARKPQTRTGTGDPNLRRPSSALK